MNDENGIITSERRKALIGDFHGRVDAGNGMVFCRYQGMNVDGLPVTLLLKAYLNEFAAVYDLAVIVEGQGNFWRIIGLQKQDHGFPDHEGNHDFPGPDVIFIKRKQL